MKKILIITFLIFLSKISFSQQVMVLNDKTSYKGKLIQMNDSLVIFLTKINNSEFELNLPRNRVKEIYFEKEKAIKPDKKVLITLKTGKQISGTLISENENEIVLKLSNKSILNENLTISKSKVEEIKEESGGKTFFELGFLKAGALVGTELEITTSERVSLYVGAGFKGFGGGLNIYANEGFEGSGFKVGYFQQGWGSTFAGSIAGVSFFYKMKPGISLDLGIGKIISRGNFDYGGKSFILIYSLGFRF